MGLKKLFCGIFNCDKFKAHEDLLMVVDDRVVAADAKVLAVDGKVLDVDTKVQSIIDIPPVADLGDLPAKVAAISATLFALMQLTPSSIWLDAPANGAKDDIISVSIMVHTNILLELETFGLQMHFDPAFFQLDSFEKGTLTQNWNSVNGNETSAGELVLGGFPGAAELSTETIGSLIVVKLKVLVESGMSEIRIDSYVDGIAKYLPSPARVSFSVE